MEMNKKCYIFGAGEYPESIGEIQTDSFVIACDGGYKIFERIQKEPDLIIGDFDSLKYIPSDGDNVVAFPKEKDDTDMALAVREGICNGCDEFYMYGTLGGKISHSYANIQLLAKMTELGVKGFLIGKDTVISAVRNSSVFFPSDSVGRISVFSFTDKSYGVSIKGLKYNVSDITLFNNCALGVSNEFTGEKAEISVKKGLLIIITEKGV